MSKATPEQMRTLISEAVVNADFRKELLKSPQHAAEKKGVLMDASDVKDLQKLADDLLRFGGNPRLHADDAKNWTFGLLQIQTVFTRKPKNNKSGKNNKDKK